VGFNLYSSLSESSKGIICDRYSISRREFDEPVDEFQNFAPTNASQCSKELLQVYGLLLPGFEVEAFG